MFGKSHYAKGLDRTSVLWIIAMHLMINIAYFVIAMIILSSFHWTKGIFNAIAAGILIYDVMIQKLTNHY